MKTPLLAVVGPTAVGKSALALELAERLGGEIVSADSRQVYRYMDVGTAKPSAGDRARVRHHLVDVVDPDQEYSFALFLRQAPPPSRTSTPGGGCPSSREAPASTSGDCWRVGRRPASRRTRT